MKREIGLERNPHLKEYTAETQLTLTLTLSPHFASNSVTAILVPIVLQSAPLPVDLCARISALLCQISRSQVFLALEEMENDPKGEFLANPEILQSKELHEYILTTSVYPREPEPLKELRKATADHPKAFYATPPDGIQLMAMLLKLVNAKNTIEIGVFTGYSLLLTALTIPDDGKITAIDVDRKIYEIGLPIIKKAGVEHKINYIESEALPVLEELLKDPKNEGSFDFAYVDADKINNWNYHKMLMKLVKVGGILLYDDTLWGGYVALPEEAVPETKRVWTKSVIEFNKSITADPCVEIAHASVGAGMLICKRIR